MREVKNNIKLKVLFKELRKINYIYYIKQERYISQKNND